MYRIELVKAALKQFNKFPRDIRAILEKKIDSLSRDPRPQGCEKLSGVPDLYRVRQGDHRIVYQIQDRLLLVLIVKVGHRREVYRRL